MHHYSVGMLVTCRFSFFFHLDSKLRLYTFSGVATGGLGGPRLLQSPDKKMITLKMKSAVCLTSSARKFIFIIAILPFHLLQTSLHCALSLAAQCIVIGPVCLRVRLCVCGLVYLFVCGSVTTITRNWCIDLHKTGLVGSDRLQLIKF